MNYLCISIFIWPGKVYNYFFFFGGGGQGIIHPPPKRNRPEKQNKPNFSKAEITWQKYRHFWPEPGTDPPVYQ